MNDSYRPRWASSLLEARLDAFPVVVLIGPRQVGKSTLLMHASALAGFHRVDLDDLEVRARVVEDPGLPWAGSDKVVVDEVQRVPALLTALKAAVDRTERRIRVVLSGSANLLLMSAVAESLAGRAAYFELLPFAAGEWESNRAPRILNDLLEGRLPPEGKVGTRDPATEIHPGFLPPTRLTPEPTVWWESYVRAYLERDLRDLARISSLPDFRRLLELLALRTAQVFNETDLARHLAISQPTVHRWVNLLAVSHLFHALPAWTPNRGKRVTRRPKVHLADPGLAAFLARLLSAEEIRGAPVNAVKWVCPAGRLLPTYLTPDYTYGMTDSWKA